jgi:hypothetical protein
MGWLRSELIFQILPSKTHNNEKVAEPFELKMSPEASQSRTPSA